MKEEEYVIDKLWDVYSAMIEVWKSLENLPNDDLLEVFSINYPFTMSFDEMTVEVGEWISELEKNYGYLQWNRHQEELRIKTEQMLTYWMENNLKKEDIVCQTIRPVSPAMSTKLLGLITKLRNIAIAPIVKKEK